MTPVVDNRAATSLCCHSCGSGREHECLLCVRILACTLGCHSEQAAPCVGTRWSGHRLIARSAAVSCSLSCRCPDGDGLTMTDWHIAEAACRGGVGGQHFSFVVIATSGDALQGAYLGSKREGEGDFAILCTGKQQHTVAKGIAPRYLSAASSDGRTPKSGQCSSTNADG